jgi:hypothetical protein
MTRARSRLACASADGEIHDAQALRHVRPETEHVPHTPSIPARQSRDAAHEDGACGVSPPERGVARRHGVPVRVSRLVDGRDMIGEGDLRYLMMSME